MKVCPDQMELFNSKAIFFESDGPFTFQVQHSKIIKANSKCTIDQNTNWEAGF